MIYVCSVYSLNSDEALREERFLCALRETTKLTKKGLPVFSPIVHSHPMALLDPTIPCTFDFWSGVDYQFIDSSSAVYVLKMDGWERSTGVTAEIKYAEMLGLPITYLEVEDSPPEFARVLDFNHADVVEPDSVAVLAYN